MAQVPFLLLSHSLWDFGYPNLPSLKPLTSLSRLTKLTLVVTRLVLIAFVVTEGSASHIWCLTFFFFKLVSFLLPSHSMWESRHQKFTTGDLKAGKLHFAVLSKWPKKVPFFLAINIYCLKSVHILAWVGFKCQDCLVYNFFGIRQIYFPDFIQRVRCQFDLFPWEHLGNRQVHFLLIIRC